MKILIVDDEKSLCRVISKYFKDKNYAVDVCNNGLDAIDYFNGTEYDAVILDIMLPGVDGIQVLKEIRKSKNYTPVILLTARTTVEDRINGLDSGADDYLIKPFALEELGARVRVLIRRNGVETNDNVLIVGPLTLDMGKHLAMREGDEIPLTAKEFSVLEYLMHNKGIVLSRDKIEKHIWNYDYAGGSNIIDVYIRSIRNKIDGPYNSKLIKTVRGVGYVIREGADE